MQPGQPADLSRGRPFSVNLRRWQNLQERQGLFFRSGCVAAYGRTMLRAISRALSGPSNAAPPVPVTCQRAVSSGTFAISWTLAAAKAARSASACTHSVAGTGRCACSPGLPPAVRPWCSGRANGPANSAGSGSRPPTTERGRQQRARPAIDTSLAVCAVTVSSRRRRTTRLPPGAEAGTERAGWPPCGPNGSIATCRASVRTWESALTGGPQTSSIDQPTRLSGKR
jgi:hypothetical protein